MGAADVVESAAVRQRLRAMFDGRPVVLAGGSLVGTARHVAELTELTGQPPFLLPVGIGTGELPDLSGVPLHVLEASAPDLLASVRAAQALLADLPADALAALDAWDPQRRAQVLPGPFFTPRRLAGRRVLEGRLADWEHLEDKVLVDALWDAAGVPRAPSAVVAATYDAGSAAARSLDRGLGTVWSGDAREGFNGGAELVRWVRDDDHARAAGAFFSGHCDRVRVMPFLDGLPCSIHGFVLPDGVAALRPVEMVTLRRLVGEVDRLVYGGISTHWDPPADDREAMREVARRTAVHLRDSVGFRGGFSVDGVLTSDGFLPTELNPRFSGGLTAFGKALPDFPLALVNAALVSESDPGLTAAELEATLVAGADARRWGGGSTMLSSLRPASTDLRHVVVSDGRVRLAGDGEAPEGELMLGPSQTGAYLHFEPEPWAVPAGSSLAPMVADAFALGDQLWGCGIGPVAPAPDVRRGR